MRERSGAFTRASSAAVITRASAATDFVSAGTTDSAWTAPARAASASATTSSRTGWAVLRQAITPANTSTKLAANAQLAKLDGLDKPTRSEFTGLDGVPLVPTINLSGQPATAESEPTGA